MSSRDLKHIERSAKTRNDDKKYFYCEKHGDAKAFELTVDKFREKNGLAAMDWEAIK